MTWRQETNQSNQNLPFLPPEIWLRIVYFTRNPKNLSQTFKSLHLLCLNPISKARWLIFTYGQENAFYGLLWFWSKSEIWKRWILKVKPDLPFPPLAPRRFFKRYNIKKAVRIYYEGWFYLSKRMKCSRCSHTALSNAKDLRLDSDIVSIDALEKQLLGRLTSNHCSFEHFQLRICMMLVEGGALPGDCLPLLLRYAAAVGHSKLLSYFISLASKDSFDPTYIMKYTIQEKYRKPILQLLKQSIYGEKILCFYLATKTDILQYLPESKWRKLFSKVMFSCSYSMGILFLQDHSQASLQELDTIIKFSTIPFLKSKSRKSLQELSMALLRTLTNQQILDGQESIVITVCENGRDDLVKYLHSKGVTFNHFGGLALFNAALFGHKKVVKVLLYECNVNPSIFHSGRLTVIIMIIIDHALLLYVLLTAILSLFIEIGCRSTRQGTSNIGLFGTKKEGAYGLCGPESPDSVPFGSIFLVILIGIGYFLLSCLVRVKLYMNISPI